MRLRVRWRLYVPDDGSIVYTTLIKLQVVEIAILFAGFFHWALVLLLCLGRLQIRCCLSRGVLSVLVEAVVAIADLRLGVRVCVFVSVLYAVASVAAPSREKT